MKKQLISIGLALVLTLTPVTAIAGDMTASEQGGGFSDSIEYSDFFAEESFNDGSGLNNHQEAPEEIEFSDEALVLEASEGIHSHCDSGVAGNSGASECSPIEYSPLTENTIKNQGTLLTGNYYLTDDADASEGTNWSIKGRSGFITIPAGESVNLCLNGHSLKGIMKKVNTLNKSVIYNTGTLTICDCQGDIGNISGGAWGIYNTGTLKIYGGNISDNNAVNYGGGIDNSGTLELYGGNISGNMAGVKGGGVYNRNKAKFKMYGGTISKNIIQANNNGNAGGGGICNEGSFEIFSGSISDNEASDSRNRGGGIWNTVFGTFTMNDGEIVGNICNGSSGGGVENNGTFHMIKGSIKKNRADYLGTGWGGGVYNTSTFTMSGGEINDNSGNRGGGVHNTSNGNFTMEGGKITGNHAAAIGGGIDTVDGKSFAIKGGIKITDNTEGENNAASNVRFSSHDPISISGALSPESKIGVRVGGQVNTTSVNFTQGQDCINYLPNFTSDDEAMYKIKIYNADSQLMLAKERTLEYAKGYIASNVPGAITGEAAPTSFYDGEAFQLPGKVFTRSGYQQIGWTRNELSTDKEWNLNGEVTINRGQFFSYVYPSWELEAPQLQGNNPIDVTAGYGTEDSPELAVEINNESYPNVTAEYTYQWYNGTECQDINLIKNANENIYTLPIGLKAGAHAYTVKVTVKDPLLKTSCDSTKTFKVTVKSAPPAYTYYTLQASAGEHGTITPSGSISVREYTDQTFAVIPEEGYEISEILVDGKKVDAASSYKFEQVTSEHAISVSFLKKVPENYPEGTVAKPDGSFETLDGVIILPDGTVILNDKDKTELKPDSQGNIAIVNKDGTVTVQDGAVRNPDGIYIRPARPSINTAEVNGNRVNIRLKESTAGAAGYDYVISPNPNCITDKDYTRVDKNVLLTNTSMLYLQQDTYYAYCHSWLRGSNGKKIFSQWSEAYEFTVSNHTPDTPSVVKVSNPKKEVVVVTVSVPEGAKGFDIILGRSVKKVNGEKRAVDYGKDVRKNCRNTLKTVIFKNVKPGTVYAALHSYTRETETNTKVFSPWSASRKVTVR